MNSDPATEAKVKHLYRLVTQCETVDSFRVTLSDPVMVTLYKTLPGPNMVGRGNVSLGKFTLDQSLEFLLGEIESDDRRS